MGHGRGFTLASGFEGHPNYVHLYCAECWGVFRVCCECSAAAKLPAGEKSNQ